MKAWLIGGAAVLLLGSGPRDLHGASAAYEARALLDRELCAQGTGMVDVDILVCRRAIRAGGLDGISLATLHNALGRAYRQRGRADKALAEHAAALELNPSSAVAYHDRGLAWVALGRLADAAADLDQALVLFPGYAQARRARGRAAFLAGEPGAAIGFLDAAIRQQPANGEAYAFRGFARFQLGDYALAAADFEHAIELNLNYPYGVLWQVLALQRAEGARARAVEVLEAALTRLEHGEWPRPLLAALRAHDGHALESQQAMLQGGVRRRYESRFYLAMGALHAGDPRRAREHLDAVLRDAPPLRLEAVMARHAVASLPRQ